MSADYLYQPWMTLKGVTSASLKVVQPIHRWLDFESEDVVVLRSDVKEMTTNVTLAIETGPSIAGPWTALTSFAGGSATKTSLVVTTDPDADSQLQRYVRWSVDPSAVGDLWTTTFQLSCRCRRPRTVGDGRRSLAETGEVQPWIALVGGATFSSDDAVVPLESYWIDTEGKDKLTLDAEILDVSNATLYLQRAMSPEGPWTDLSNIATAYCLYRITLETSDTANFVMGRYIRWSVASSAASWRICFRINARSWP